MSNNSNPGKHAPAKQHVQSSNHGGLEDRKDQAMSSQMTHEDRAQHDAHESSEASSTKGGSSRFEDQGKVGCRNARGDGKHYSCEYYMDFEFNSQQLAIFSQEKRGGTR